MKANICRFCGKEIQDRDELVTATSWFKLHPFHYNCYQEVEKEMKSVWGMWKPVNGESGNIRVILMVALIIWLTFWNPFDLLGNLIAIIALYPIILRIISYVIIERQIPNLQKQHRS